MKSLAKAAIVVWGSAVPPVIIRSAVRLRKQRKTGPDKAKLLKTAKARKSGYAGLKANYGTTVRRKEKP